MDILDEIVAYKRLEVERMKGEQSLDEIRQQAIHSSLPIAASMRESLLRNGYGIIAEFKRRSPSKGWINAEASAEGVCLGYERGGAAAVSILTDNRFFGGDNSYIVSARNGGLTLPVLYKNFIVDEYQIYQARIYGASAVLLIAACLDEDACGRYIDIARRLGMEVLLEIHSDEELSYASLRPDIIGVNNRNLGSFATDVANSFRLASRLPSDICKVSESGISDPATVARLIEAGYSGFLIGENFMRAANQETVLRDFRIGIEQNLSGR